MNQDTMDNDADESPAERSDVSRDTIQPPLLDPIQLQRWGLDRKVLGVIVVDHGSRRAESNELLVEVARRFQDASGLELVEPAHMELAEPTIATAFDRLVNRGATMVVVFPYFLGPGRHWTEDIPRLVAVAAKRHVGVKYLVTAPFGLHPLVHQIIADRIMRCVAQTHETDGGCEICTDRPGCRLLEAGDDREHPSS